jgi:hypothetical protein
MKLMLPTMESGWMTHMKGVGDLVDRLGPEPFNSGILHTLFIGLRPLLVSHEHYFTRAAELIIDADFIVDQLNPDPTKHVSFTTRMDYYTVWRTTYLRDAIASQPSKRASRPTRAIR